MGGRGGDPLGLLWPCAQAPCPSCHLWVQLGARGCAHQKAERALLAPPGMNVGLVGKSLVGRGAAVWQLLFLERWVDRTPGEFHGPSYASSESLAASLPGNRGRVGWWLGAAGAGFVPHLQRPVCLRAPPPPPPWVVLFMLPGISFCRESPRALVQGRGLSLNGAQQMAPGPPPSRGGSCDGSCCPPPCQAAALHAGSFL